MAAKLMTLFLAAAAFVAAAPAPASDYGACVQVNYATTSIPIECSTSSFSGIEIQCVGTAKAPSNPKCERINDGSSLLYFCCPN